MRIARRSFLSALIVGPAIVRAASIMPVKPLPGIPFAADIGYGVIRWEAPGEWRRFGAFEADTVISGECAMISAIDPTKIERVVWHGLARDVPKELARVSVPIRFDRARSGLT